MEYAALIIKHSHSGYRAYNIESRIMNTESPYFVFCKFEYVVCRLHSTFHILNNTHCTASTQYFILVTL